MRYLSVCSGIEAASVAWHSLGWEPVAFSEIEQFPRAVLAHHYPSVPHWGDMTKFQEWPDAAVDVLVGGTPCQSFSVAGLRQGLHDPRGGLMLTFLEIAQRYRPRWVVWENVPGVLSSNGGRDFGAFLGALGELGYGWAYRVLDAQWFGVAQRRRRVFVVGCLGDQASAAAVLFESESVQRHPPPSRETRQGVAPTIAGSSNGGGANGQGRDADSADSLIPELANPLTARMHKGINTTCDEGQTMVAHAFDAKQSEVVQYGDRTGPLDTQGHSVAVALQNMAVRRLTPRECERLQGFPDDYTLISYRGKPAADGPRYKALGNSMAVPVMRWIGQRLQAVAQIGDTHAR